MSGELQHRLRQLRENFARQLPDKLLELDRLLSSLLQIGWSDTVAQELHLATHKLAGSSGTFGFMELGKQARQFELQLDAISKGESVDTSQYQALQAALEQLHTVAQQDGKSFYVPLQVAGRLKPLALRPVFIVDDDPQQCEFIASGLIGHGYEVVVCEDLARLEVMLEEQDPGAIIMDLSFPEGPMAGSDLVGRIKSQQLLQVPVVFVSSHNTIASRLQAVRAGGDAYFPKPLKLKELVDSLDYLVAKGHAEPYKVLIVDDDYTLAEYHAEVLRRAGLSVEVLCQPLDILEAIAGFRPELLLLDLHMPECTGIELANLLRQHTAYINLPIVFLSAEEDARKHFEARLVGADDFLIKPISEEFLIAAVVNRVQRSRSAEQLITSDSMTALLNHEALVAELERQLAQAQREGAKLSFCMLDLDHFKHVNDSYGHIVGDAVIKSFADVLKERLRRTDMIGRYGGEEFAVIMPDTSLQQAEQVAREICQKFADVEHYCGEEVFTVTVSVGIAQLSDCDDKKSIMEGADKALYGAKNAGRNRVHAYQP